MIPDCYVFITHLTVSEFRDFKRGLALLGKNGISQDSAVEILINGIRSKRAWSQTARDARVWRKTGEGA